MGFLAFIQVYSTDITDLNKTKIQMPKPVPLNFLAHKKPCTLCKSLLYVWGSAWVTVQRGKRERQREREREAKRETDRQRETDTERETERERQREREKERQIQRETEIEAETDGERGRERDTHTQRQTDRETETQRQRERDRQRDTQTRQRQLQISPRAGPKPLEMASFTLNPKLSVRPPEQLFLLQ